ncbi:class I SAM-dependent methyltransferase [Oceanicoccus sp. KOV_DT_Chl]|uniref:class I SAM-dependent methyltransferase n=1 Tax=Oceanicoccus sp. KOV_DT_Chl TaxID=1904639 RepID=UPI000C7A0F48|nr:class I SAM-dependent methyltransferase [Oceanicoccus sp. KOV_DT_Chl]
MSSLAHLIAVQNHAVYSSDCQQLAQQLQLQLVETEPSTPFVLIVDERGVAIQQTGPKAPGPVRVDFLAGASEHRRKQGGGELIVKAVAGDKQNKPTVLDATAGLGRDSFVLASCGYPVTLCERSPLIAALLADGLQRAAKADEVELRNIVNNMRLINTNAVEYMQLLGSQSVDAVVIDPMFPPSKKSALVKKEMQVFHQLVGADNDSEALIEQALLTARHRVVVKRPKKAEHLAARKPNFSVEGKAIRFDIYSLKAYGK